MMSVTMIYTIVSTGADADKGFFPDPQVQGSYLGIQKAREELNRLVEEEKENLDNRYDCEERSEDHWEAYMDGYAAACFSRIEILTSRLMDRSVVS